MNLSTHSTPPWSALMSRYGEAIFERRDLLGLTGPEVAAMSEQLAASDPARYAKFSQQTLSRWESDKTGAIIGASSPARLRALATALQWSSDEFEDSVGVPLGAGRAIESGKVKLVGGLVMVPLVGVANGGMPTEYVLPVKPSLVRGGNTRAFQVSGNSMAVGPDGGIQDGDWVLVDIALRQPVNGKVFLLEVIGDGMTVKRLRNVDGQWVFMSDNPEAGEAWREDQVRIVGRVYGKVDYTEIL